MLHCFHTADRIYVSLKSSLLLCKCVGNFQLPSGYQLATPIILSQHSENDSRRGMIKGQSSMLQRCKGIIKNVFSSRKSMAEML
ncbi:hypothetical protein XELAEV_18005227mg [Xenopus laevis]|uniref:Uncharacterized protein n=1 Tax=Xenopus laevis TaxID=8355 RepID=A0A974DYZ3_XENLA|nr:hypothetical protein XELAEV_18005227mg [Xenopus laevis]